MNKISSIKVKSAYDALNYTDNRVINKITSNNPDIAKNFFICSLPVITGNKDKRSIFYVGDYSYYRYRIYKNFDFKYTNVICYDSNTQKSFSNIGVGFDESEPFGNFFSDDNFPSTVQKDIPISFIGSITYNQNRRLLESLLPYERTIAKKVMQKITNSIESGESHLLRIDNTILNEIGESFLNLNNSKKESFIRIFHPLDQIHRSLSRIKVISKIAEEGLKVYCYTNNSNELPNHPNIIKNEQLKYSDYLDILNRSKYTIAFNENFTSGHERVFDALIRRCTPITSVYQDLFSKDKILNEACIPITTNHSDISTMLNKKAVSSTNNQEILTKHLKENYSLENLTSTIEKIIRKHS